MTLVIVCCKTGALPLAFLSKTRGAGSHEQGIFPSHYIFFPSPCCPFSLEENFFFDGLLAWYLERGRLVVAYLYVRCASLSNQSV